ncbi:S8 family peptidase [Sutcliffiella horikoshii]|uniref:S8 family peptidase n=1 Tax=Sutcliffiella horikoshii TaxID=79883 RepID=UPI00384B6A83
MIIVRTVLLSILVMLGVGLLCWDYFNFDETPVAKPTKNLKREVQVSPWGLEAMGIDFSTSDSPMRTIKVAVLDSGIYQEHEDLKGKVVAEFNAIDPGEPVVDDLGHGTAIAGIIAANNNNIGVVGVARSVELYDVKVLDKQGRGEPKNLVSAIEWCVSQGIDVINISFGYQAESLIIKKAIKDALDFGIIIVASAGNTYGLNADFPAKYENVFSITAVDQELLRVKTSARGKIDFAAPGKEILSTDHEGGYSLFNGTSFATAYATGFIATLLQHSHKKLNHIELKNLLLENAHVLDEEHLPSKEYGYGILKLNN